MTEATDPASNTRVVSSFAFFSLEWAHELFASIMDLSKQVAALRLGSSAAPAAHAYPPQPIADALALLEQDPRMPDFLKLLLPPLMYNLARTDERASPLNEAVHATLLYWLLVQPLPSPRPAPTMTSLPPHRHFHTPYLLSQPARSYSPHRGRFISMNGHIFCKSAQGKPWDTAQLHSYPCRLCPCLYWNFAPCPAPSTP